MSRKENADPAASALAQKKWDQLGDDEKSQHAQKMAEARWAGHVAKRPASARNTGKPRGRPPKKVATKTGAKKRAVKRPTE